MLAKLMFYRHNKTSVSIQQQKENLCHFYCFFCDGDGVLADLGFVKYEIDFCSFLKLIPGVKALACASIMNRVIQLNIQGPVRIKTHTHTQTALFWRCWWSLSSFKLKTSQTGKMLVTLTLAFSSSQF